MKIFRTEPFRGLRSGFPCLLTFSLALLASGTHADEHLADIIIYGGTSAAITAAVQAKTMGKSVIIVSPDKHLGGLSSGGLGWTDTGNKAVIGGLSRQFYHRVFLHYDRAEAWTWQDRESYGNRGQGNRAMDGNERTMWIFEPHVAESIFDAWVREHDIPVHRDAWLDRGPGGVERSNTDTAPRITAIRTMAGDRYTGGAFIDATYEGDLIAAANIDTHVGREGRDIYGEEWNGNQITVLHHRHHFDAIPSKKRIDPFRIPGDPASGLLPRISPDPPGERHAGDHRVQAYCFRMCLTDKAENRVPFPKPDGYDPDQYLLLLRIFDAGWRDVFWKFDPIPNRKTDTNNHGPFSFDNIGMNYAYPNGTYAERRAMIAEHTTYQQGLLYFLTHDPRVPADVRKRMAAWGLPKDEFTDNGHWAHQLYIREARRMVGHHVMTEHELLQRRPTPQPVGMGSYTIDSHNVRRYVTAEGYVQNEGDIGVKCPPYPISYGSLLPRRDQCANLLAPVAVSASHIAFGSIRMEPVFMILGQSAATAAALALDNAVPVQDVDYPTLRDRLLADGQVLDYTRVTVGDGLNPKKLPGTVIDDTAAVRSGEWKNSTSVPHWVALGYLHNSNQPDGRDVRFDATLPAAGEYEVRLAYTANANRATNVPLTLTHASGTATKTINQRTPPPIDGLWISLGTFDFHKTASLTIGTTKTDGYVIADAVQWLPK